MSDKQDFTSTSQKFLEVHEIIDDILILKNGSTALILSVNAMNFGLLAEEEQDAIIYSYASLLNSINYPVQIIIRSETKDASSYLKILEERKKETDSQVKREWLERYSQFVSNLIKERNVLDKKFYVVIPASGLEMGLTPAQNLISSFKEADVKNIDTNIILEKAHNLLEPKRDHLVAQFNRIGLYARQLKTQEIIRLFYTSYNPETSEGQQITNSQSYTAPLVQAQIRGNRMVNATNQATNNNQAPQQSEPATTQQPASNQQTAASLPSSSNQRLAGNQQSVKTPAQATDGGQAVQPQQTQVDQASQSTQATPPANSNQASPPSVAEVTPSQAAQQVESNDQPVAQKQTTLQESPSLQQPTATKPQATAQAPIDKPAPQSNQQTTANQVPTNNQPQTVGLTEPNAPEATPPTPATQLNPTAQPVTQTTQQSPTAPAVAPATSNVQAQTITQSGQAQNSTEGTINITSPNKEASNEKTRQTTPTPDTSKEQTTPAVNPKPTPDPKTAQEDINSTLKDLNSKG